MEKFEVQFCETQELSERDFRSIIAIKQQHWDYSIDSQIKWFRKNIFDNDFHIIIKQGERIIAYLNLVNVNVFIDEKEYLALGVGNVCVDKEYKGLGWGLILIRIVNSLIKRQKRFGLLLCKDNLIGFYSKGDWKLFNVSKVRIGTLDYHNTVMIYDPYLINDKDGVVSIEIDRNF